MWPVQRQLLQVKKQVGRAKVQAEEWAPGNEEKNDGDDGSTTNGPSSSSIPPYAGDRVYFICVSPIHFPLIKKVAVNDKVFVFLHSIFFLSQYVVGVYHTNGYFFYHFCLLLLLLSLLMFYVTNFVPPFNGENGNSCQRWRRKCNPWDSPFTFWMIFF